LATADDSQRPKEA